MMKKCSLTTKKKLNISTAMRLATIFKDNNWEIRNNENESLSLFNKFCNMINRLNSEQQELIINLVNCNTNFQFVP